MFQVQDTCRKYDEIVLQLVDEKFQLDSVKEVAVFYKAMFGFGEAGFIRSMDIFYGKSYLLMLAIAIVASTPLLRNLYKRIPAKIQSVLTPVMIFAVLIVSTAYLVDATYNPFLYFRF